MGVFHNYFNFLFIALIFAKYPTFVHTLSTLNKLFRTFVADKT